MIATGDINIDIKANRYKNRQKDDAIDDYKLTDKKLKALEKKGDLNWNNNNWFEVMYMPKGTKTWDSIIGDVIYSYDEAIERLQAYIDDDDF